MTEQYDVEIGLNENITDAAKRYYELSKKMKKKIEGVKIALEISRKKLKDIEKIKTVEKTHLAKRDKFWFEKYRWSFTRTGKLIIAGKDAITNEIIVKKYMDKNDLHFHTNIQGAAHTILKEGQDVSKEDLEDAATIAAIYSKAVSAELSSVDVYYVKPEQISKTANTGEYLSTGAFVVRGERTWFKKVPIEFTVGIVNAKNFGLDDVDIIMVANKQVFMQYNSPYYKTLGIGSKSKNDICKDVLKQLEKLGYKQFDVNDLLSVLPAGKFDFKKER